MTRDQRKRLMRGIDDAWVDDLFVSEQDVKSDTNGHECSAPCTGGKVNNLQSRISANESLGLAPMKKQATCGRMINAIEHE